MYLLGAGISVLCPMMLVTTKPLLLSMVRRSLACATYTFFSPVLVGPVITVSPMDMNVSIDVHDIVLTCAAIGVPIPNIMWIHNGSAIDIDDMNITVETTPMEPGMVSSTITIPSAAANNTGSYACNATSGVEFYDPVMSEPALVLVQGMPHIFK